MNKPVKIAALILVAAFGLLQLYPVDRHDPPSRGALDVPAGEVGEILRAACLDCHSNETVWPWYSRIAPASFFIASHVEEGREHLNFSTWSMEDSESVDHMLEEIEEVLEEGEMPLWSYTVLHPEARLTESQRRLLMGWARDRRAGLGASSEPDSSEDREETEGRRGGEPD